MIGGGASLAFLSGVVGQTLGLAGIAPVLGGLGLAGQYEVGSDEGDSLYLQEQQGWV